VLYRKREWVECGHEHGGIARFRIQRLEGSRSGLRRTRVMQILSEFRKRFDKITNEY